MQQYIIRFVFFAVPSRSQIEVADAFDHSREIFAAYKVPGGFGADGFGKGQGQRGRAWEGSTEGQVLASWLVHCARVCCFFLFLCIIPCSGWAQALSEAFTAAHPGHSSCSCHPAPVTLLVL